MKTINQLGFMFKMIGGKWFRADQFPHLEADNGTLHVWWPTDRPDVIPTNPDTAVIISDQLNNLYSLLNDIKNEFIKTNTTY